MKNLLFTVILAFFVNSVIAQNSIVGTWKTIDDNSGKPRSVVEIYKQGDRYFGKVLKTFPNPGEDPDPICDLCSDERKDKKVIGMEIIQDMRLEDDEYVGGEILDPENGKIYRCKLWIEDNVLNVRGYVAFFYRTQKWYKFSSE